MIEPQAIETAARRIAGRVHRTPLLENRSLSERTGVDLRLKCECFQKTGSFKPRGALNKVLALDDEARSRGLITTSAGNHAQAVAWAAREVGCRAVVVMPTAAPASKIAAVEGYGAEIVLHEDRRTLFDRLAAERDARGMTFVHPFDDPVVLAGAATVGREIVDDFPDVEAVVVPVGGGGLIGGVASAIKAYDAGVRVIGVELAAGPGLRPALAAGEPVTVTRPDDTLADGLTPPFVGALALDIARRAVDEIVVVEESEIVDAMRLLLTRAKLVVEGGGAAGVAAMLAGRVAFVPGARVVAVVSGGNVDPARLGRALA